MSEEEALDEYLEGDMPFDEFRSAVSKYFKLNFRNESRRVDCVADVPFTLEVTPRKLQPMLQSYVAGKRSAEDVSRWASVIVLVPAFTRPEFTGRSNDPGDYMWELLYDLSAPPVERSVTISRVHRVLEKLEALQHQFAKL